MASEKQLELSWLIPDFSNFQLIPTTGAELSTLFVVLLIVICLTFTITFLFHFARTQVQLRWLSAQLKELNRENIAEKREALYESASRRKKSIGHLWLEFDETLVEVRSGDTVQIRNTIDAGHFFNTHTLAKQVTENRLIAAVPGFLTAVGVIGTFVGLQLGLSELNLGAGVEAAEMQEGVAGVVDGAKVAFLTSVWGVALSVLFNFGEKFLEQRVRNRIQRIEYTIDKIFPRIRPEDQLQAIAEHSSESREVLQGLAEKIGEKMQDALVTATQGIQSSLEESLSNIMAPAINKLVDETSEGNQKALEGLLNSFMDGFGKAGNDQRQALDDVSSRVSESVDAMQATMNGFVQQLQASQAQSTDREKALIADISNQVNKLSNQSEEIHQNLTTFISQQLGGISTELSNREASAAKREEELVSNIKQQVDELVHNSRSQGEKLTQFVEIQLSSLTKTFDEREQRAKESDERRNQKIEAQTNAMSDVTKQVLTSVESAIKEHINSAEKLINQGQALQNSINSSVEANAQATQAMRESSNELRISADSMKVLSSHVNDAGNKLSGAIREAVQSTADLAKQNQLSSEKMEQMRTDLLAEVAKFGELSDKLNGMVHTAGTTFNELKSSQREFISELKGEVGDLSKRMTQLLDDYASQANSQTAQHLKVWSESVTQYSSQMTSAVNALANVVDSIEAKLG